MFTKLLIAEAIVGAVGFLLAEFFPRQLIAIFGAANESSYYTEFAVKAFRFALILPVFFGLDGVLFSMPVSDLLTFLIALVLIRQTHRELSKKGGAS